MNKISIRKNNTHLNTSFFKGNLNRNQTLKMFKFRRRNYLLEFYVYENAANRILQKDISFLIKKATENMK